MRTEYALSLYRVILAQWKNSVNKYNEFFNDFFTIFTFFIVYDKSYTVNRYIIVNNLVIFDIAQSVAFYV